MILTDILETVGDVYLQREAQKGAGTVSNRFSWTPDVPFIDLVPEAPTGNGGSAPKGMVWDPNANCGSGKWIKRRARRRRRLATPTDIADLAALEAVLGKGKTFNTWIATRKC